MACSERLTLEREGKRLLDQLPDLPSTGFGRRVP
jgi:hypothetical protein